MWRKGFAVGQHLQSSYHWLGLNLTECNLLVMIERVRVRTNCSREQDFVILSCPLTNSDRPKFGPIRISDELDGMHVWEWDAIYFSPDQPFTFQAVIQIG